MHCTIAVVWKLGVRGWMDGMDGWTGGLTGGRGFGYFIYKQACAYTLAE